MPFQGVYYKYCIGCRAHPNLTKRMSLSCRTEVLVNLEQVSALFFGTFIVEFEYSMLSLNAILWPIFVEHQIGVILMEVVAKHYFAIVPMARPIRCSSQIFVCKLL